MMKNGLTKFFLMIGSQFQKAAGQHQKAWLHPKVGGLSQGGTQFCAGGSSPAWGNCTLYKHVLCSIWSLLSHTCYSSKIIIIK